MHTRRSNRTLDKGAAWEAAAWVCHRDQCHSARARLVGVGNSPCCPMVRMLEALEEETTQGEAGARALLGAAVFLWYHNSRMKRRFYPFRDRKEWLCGAKRRLEGGRGAVGSGLLQVQCTERLCTPEEAAAEVHQTVAALPSGWICRRKKRRLGVAPLQQLSCRALKVAALQEGQHGAKAAEVASSFSVYYCWRGSTTSPPKPCSLFSRWGLFRQLGPLP